MLVNAVCRKSSMFKWVSSWYTDVCLLVDPLFM